MVRVRLFAALRELAGASELEVDADDVGSLLDGLAGRFGPSFERIASAGSVVVSGERSGRDRRLSPQDEVAVLPPVSGGSSQMKELPGLRVWGMDHIEPGTIEQALTMSRLPIMAGPVALMPDAHEGLGSTVGSVFPTVGAVIPAAVGVDIGCGMIAARTDLTLAHLPDSLDGYVAELETLVPAGLGRWHQEPAEAALAWMAANPVPEGLRDPGRAAMQLGTLGSGNHFVEVTHDENDRVWLIMHSGSRGAGHHLAELHIKVAKALCAEQGIELENRDLAYLQEGTPQFDAYIRAMLWAQAYAMENRRLLMDAAMRGFLGFVGAGSEVERLNCHHNFTQREEVDGREVWVTRKGAIKSDRGDLGLIPGHMGGKSYVVRGLGSSLSYRSSSHGAGRAMSRTRARKTLDLEAFAAAMGHGAWQRDKALELLDEAPGSYKDIDAVMQAQRDLVQVIHVLRGIANYKGTT
jgi:RNA-splicing ligase RtcB/molybdopterin converting factor small subunit